MKLVCQKTAIILFAAFISAIPALANAKTFEVYPGCEAPKAPINAFYVDPLKGSKDGDGSAAKPWRTLQEVLTSGQVQSFLADDRVRNANGKVKGGDIIYLRSGNHGDINLDAYFNKEFISVVAEAGHVPTLTNIRMFGGSKWAFDGLTFIGANGMRLDSTANKDVVFNGNTLMSAPDAANWTPEQWLAKGVNAGNYGATCVSLTNNLFKFLRHGPFISGNKALIKNNIVDFFGDDGMRFSADNATFQSNRITNHYPKLNDGNHNDGIQGWRLDGIANTNLVIDSNIVIETTGEYAEIPAHTTVWAWGSDYLQGIAIFDGAWKNVRVTNNVVVTSAWHALSFYGIDGGLIANNTVTSSMPTYGLAKPWIGVYNNKNGTPPKNVIVRNNIADSYAISGASPTVFDHNITLKKGDAKLDPALHFAKYDATKGQFDMRLKAGSTAIGAGSKDLAPLLDVAGNKRGNVIDAGAFAYSAIVNTPTTPPVTTPPPVTTTPTPTTPTTPPVQAVTGSITVVANARQTGTPTLVVTVDGKQIGTAAIKADIHYGQVASYSFNFSSTAKPKTITVTMAGYKDVEQKYVYAGVFNVGYKLGTSTAKPVEVLRTTATAKKALGKAVVSNNVIMPTNGSGVSIDVSKF